MKLSASIMAHPVRTPLVEDLLASLDRDVPVSWDNTGPPTSQSEQRWANGRGAWEMADSSADWHVVIQDDALVCDDFLAGLEAALGHLSDEAHVMSSYIGTKRPVQTVFQRIARDPTIANASWVQSLTLNWGVAVAVRTAAIEPMLECATEHGRGLGYDTRISRYFRDEADVDCWYSWPSLASHREVPSLISHGDVGRYARNFHVGSALDIDWNGATVQDPRLGRAAIMRARPNGPEMHRRAQVLRRHERRVRL
jgi:hypothetical protein